MNIKDLFENAEDGKLTYEQFEAMAKESGAKFADLSDGKYVSVSKFDSAIKAKDNEIATRDEQINTLNETISTRDTDLAQLQEKLKSADEDATKLADLTTSLSDLQSKYEADVKNYKDLMAQQKYEFAVKEFANTKQFSSEAAKRDFTREMLAKQLQMEGDRLIGADDFVSIYSEQNADAFKVELPEPEPIVTEVSEVVSHPIVEEPKVEEVEPDDIEIPEVFVGSAQGFDSGDEDWSFDFQGVRSH
jgi:DNA repair exonuclease SbcCD ATPase subunit